MSLREDIVACGAIKFGDFTLASGRKSRYYVDIKKASANPRILHEIGRELAKHVSGYDRIAGMELGAVPIAVAASLASGVPYVIVRKTAKAHGTGSLIEGDYRPGERVLVVEDVTTSGGSSLVAVRVLREAGLVVERVVTVVDRDEGAEAAFAAANVKLEALVHAGELVPK
ncbi:MAG: orotate phosphoribosyltransferase [Thermoplasmatota archaeon]